MKKERRKRVMEVSKSSIWKLLNKVLEVTPESSVVDPDPLHERRFWIREGSKNSWELHIKIDQNYKNFICLGA